MKLNKIICDICDHDINIEVDEDLAMFERIRTQTKINLQPSLFSNRRPKDLETEKELVKTTFDLCKKCAADTEDFLIKKRDEYHAKVEKIKNN